MNKKAYKIIFAMLFLLTSVIVHAGQGTPPPPAPPPVGDEVPIDGNIGVLLVVIVVYGLYKIYYYKKNLKTSN